MPTGIFTIGRIVPTIGVHVVAQEALAGGDEGVGIDKSAELGIVISGLEVVQLRFLGIVLAMMAKMAAFQRLLKQHFFT